MKKTAVEYIEDYLKFKGLIIDKPNIPQVLVGIIKQAKEMEKQQIIDACYFGSQDLPYEVKDKSEQYYNETFKNK
jgi:hypothetical protein